MARGQSRRDFARHHEQGNIPRYDLGADAQRLAVHDADRIGKVQRLAMQAVGGTREEFELADRVGQVEIQRLADGLTVVQRFEDGIFFKARLEAARRSEEHTSELQSLMRLSYAVFCLAKKKNTVCKQHNERQTKNTL